MVKFARGLHMHFIAHRWDNTETAVKYLCGLMQADRANMERMEEVVPEVDYQAMQQFISNSPWDMAGLMATLAQRVNGLLGGQADSALIIDPSAFAKKGQSSVGVARQWNGRLGKQDNCQVGVFAALCSGFRAALLDFELYLPKSWSLDRERCLKAQMPEEEIRYRSKSEIALAMVRRQRSLGTAFRWVLADAEFHGMGFCRALEADGEQFIVHMQKTRQVLLDAPGEGPPVAGDFIEAQTCSLEDYATKHLDPGDCQVVFERQGEKGQLRLVAHRRRVWVWDEVNGAAQHWWLLVMRRDGETQLRFVLSNASAETSLTELVNQDAKRYWIERQFQDAKSEVGMAEYQVRTWLGWHHHMAMCCLALLFMLQQRLIHEPTLPMLSARDIRIWLENFLPRRLPTATETESMMLARHQRRQTAKASACARQRPMDPRMILTK